jgi:hypothetical protein
MPPVGFEPIISAGKWPKTYALDRAAAGTGYTYIGCLVYRTSSYRAVNNPHVGYKKQSFSVVKTKSRCLLRDPYKTHKYILWEERRIFRLVRKIVC